MKSYKIEQLEPTIKTNTNYNKKLNYVKYEINKMIKEYSFKSKNMKTDSKLESKYYIDNHLYRKHKAINYRSLKKVEESQKDGEKTEEIFGSYKFEDNRYPESKANCSENKHSVISGVNEYDRPEHPPNPFGKTLIEIDVVLNKLYDMDLNRNLFSARGSMSFVWCDPRNKFDHRYGEYKLLYDDGAELALAYGLVWTPEIRFRNGYEVRTPDNVRIYNFYDGTMLYREKFTATLQTMFNLAKIPFDRQVVKLEVGSLTFDDEYLYILEEESSVKVVKDFKMPEFQLISTQKKMVQMTDAFSKRQFSYVELEFTLQRYWANYILKIITPIYFLILLSSLVFSYPNDEFYNRTSIILNCIFATVAYQIVVEEFIPKFLFSNYLNVAVFMGIVVMSFGCLLGWVFKYLNENGYVLAAKKISFWFILWYNLSYIIVLVDLYIAYVMEVPIGGVFEIIWVILGLSFILYCLSENPRGEEALLLEKDN